MHVLNWTTEIPMEAAPAVTKSDEPQLIASSLKGDNGAFELLIHRYQHRVFRLAGRFFRQREDVEDAAQDTFLTAWKKLDTYQARAPFEHWLTRVCLNCCYGKLRKQKPTSPIFDSEAVAPHPDPDARLEVERLLQNLPPKDRFILLLLDGQGWSVADIADKLGWTKVNVKVRAHRARKKLRKILSEDL